MAIGVAIPRPRRWDRPLAPDMTEGDVLRVLFTLRVFGAIDQGQFSFDPVAAGHHPQRRTYPALPSWRDHHTQG